MKIMRISHRKVASLSFGLIIVAGLIYKLVREYGKVSDISIAFNKKYIVISIVCFVVFQYCLALLWVQLINREEMKISKVELVRIYLISQLAKYIPGGIWNYAGRIYLIKAKGISTYWAAMTMVYETVFTLIGAALILLGINIFMPKQIVFNLSSYTRSFSSIFLLFGLLLFFNFKGKEFIDYLIRKFNKDCNYSFCNVSLNSIEIIKYILFYGLNWLIFLEGFYVFTRSLDSNVNPGFSALSVVFIVSWVLGFISPTPSGIGVREGIMTYLLSFFLPETLAITISLISRIWLIAGEIIAVSLFFLVFRRKKNENPYSYNHISKMGE